MTRLLAVAFKHVNELTRISIIRLTRTGDSRPLGCFGKLLSVWSNFVHRKQNYTRRSDALRGHLTLYTLFSSYKNLYDIVRKNYVLIFQWNIKSLYHYYNITIVRIYNFAIRMNFAYLNIYRIISIIMGQCRDSSGHCARRWKCGFITSARSTNRAAAITWFLCHGVPRWKANEWLLAAERTMMMMMTMIIITAVSRYDDPAAAEPMIHERLLAPGSLLPTLFSSLSISFSHPLYSLLSFFLVIVNVR